MWKRILLVVFILFCIELGVILVLIPWSEFWTGNVLLSLFPGLRRFVLDPYVRGACTGLGLLNMWVGVADAWNFRETVEEMERQAAAQRHPREPASSLPPAPSETNRPLRG